MPKTPTGAKRPADVIGNAVHVMRIATRQIEENRSLQKVAARKAASVGGKARAEKLGKAKRTEIAKKAAKSRWKTSARSD